MSKYSPLRQYLASRQADEAPMTFADVERVLGFGLPNSARSYQAWWANESSGSHVQKQAWLHAGWKTSRVDLSHEKLVFVRSDAHRPSPTGHGPQFRNSWALAPEALSPAATKMMAEYLERAGGDASAALAQAINDAAVARRKTVLERLMHNAPRVSVDSTNLVREDRDGR